MLWMFRNGINYYSSALKQLDEMSNFYERNKFFYDNWAEISRNIIKQIYYW
jgi:hypothetical protein